MACTASEMATREEDKHQNYMDSSYGGDTYRGRPLEEIFMFDDSQLNWKASL